MKLFTIEFWEARHSVGVREKLIEREFEREYSQEFRITEQLGVSAVREGINTETEKERVEETGREVQIGEMLTRDTADVVSLEDKVIDPKQEVDLDQNKIVINYSSLELRFTRKFSYIVTVFKNYNVCMIVMLC